MSKEPDLRRPRGVIPLVILVLTVTSAATFFSTLQPLEQKLYDLRARWISRRVEPDPRIVIIAIDEKSLQQMQATHGPWPWPRALFGSVFEMCHTARTVAVDLLFSEQSPDDSAAGDLFTGVSAPGNILLASVFTQEGPREQPPGPSGVQVDPDLADDLHIVDYARLIQPAPAYTRRVAGIGFANYLTDTDGIVRGHQLVARAGNAYAASLPLEACRHFLGHQPADVRVDRTGLSLAGQRFPTDRFCRYRFVPIEAAYPTVSFVDVLDGSVSSSFFADKLVFLGSTAAGMQADRQVSSVHVYTPGVRMQAWAADGLLNHRYVRLVPRGAKIVLALLLAMLPFLLRIRKPLHAVASLVLHLGVLAALAMACLWAGYWMIPVATLTFATILGHAAAGTSGWVRDRAQRLRLEHLEHQKQQFTDMLVHDLRNQLAPVSMAFSIDSEKARREATPMPRHLAAGQQSLSRTMVLLNTLLDIRRTTAGRMPVSPSVFSLADLLAGLADTYRPMATRRGLSIETDANPKHAQVVLDPDLVQRILENLLLNALQYATKDSTIEIEGSVRNEHVVLELRNHGPAIPPGERERIFELFGTGSTTERRTFGGTGIGLAFCRQAVDAMGGQVDIESPWRDGQGVRIILTLPQGAKPE